MTLEQEIVELVRKKLTEINEKFTKESPIVFGISGPQGIGKTTIIRNICNSLYQDGINANYLSLDDYYLNHKDMLELYEITGDSLYQARGNPGTHNVSLLYNHIDTLRQNRPISSPIYDKLAHDGVGDQSKQSRSVKTPLQVLFVEGWMLGFHSKSSPQAPLMLVAINRALKMYEAIWKLIDFWILLRIDDLDYVYEWRYEQEVNNSKAAGRSCQSKESINAFVNNFMPAYNFYYTNLPKILIDKFPSESVYELNITKERAISQATRVITDNIKNIK